MATFKDLEDSLKKFMIDEQADAHNVRNMNITKYNNMRIWMDPAKFQQPHFIVRISISEAVFSLADCSKINGGIKDRIRELWGTTQGNEEEGK